MMAAGALSVRDRDVNTEQGLLKERVRMLSPKLSSMEHLPKPRLSRFYYRTILKLYALHNAHRHRWKDNIRREYVCIRPHCVEINLVLSQPRLCYCSFAVNGISLLTKSAIVPEVV